MEKENDVIKYYWFIRTKRLWRYNYRRTNESKQKQTLLLQREKLAYLFQNYALMENETVEKNLLIALEYQKISIKENNKRSFTKSEFA